MMQLKLLLVLALALQVWTIARAPAPFCQSKPLFKQFPLALEEILSHDMADTFYGYNLEIVLPAENPIASISKKWQVLDTKYNYFPNIISHYLEPKDNTFAKDSFLLYRDNAGTIKLSYGQIKRDGFLPEINSTVEISKDPDVNCFDAALFLEHGMAVVDCTKKGGKVFSTYTNYWYIADLTNHSIKKIIKNDLYIGFTSISKRQLLKFSHPEAGGFTYMLRTYFSDGVDKEHSDNTYMEIFIVPVEDPTEIEPLRVIDRTFLNLNVLRIMDVQLYLDDIFLLDYDTGLFRLDILQSQIVAITGRYRDRGFTKFGIYSDDLQDECIVAVANQHTLF